MTKAGPISSMFSFMDFLFNNATMLNLPFPVMLNANFSDLSTTAFPFENLYLYPSPFRILSPFSMGNPKETVLAAPW